MKRRLWNVFLRWKKACFLMAVYLNRRNFPVVAEKMNILIYE